MRAISILLIALAATACPGLDVAIAIPAADLHLDRLLEVVRDAHVPQGGVLTITAWFHPADQVVAIYELPRRDLDADSAVIGRLVFRNAGSQRIATTFTTTAAWMREADHEVKFHRIELDGRVCYLRTSDVDRATCVELLSRLRAGDYQAWQRPLAGGDGGRWDDVTVIQRDPTAADGSAGYLVFRGHAGFAVFTFLCGDLREVGCGVIRS